MRSSSSLQPLLLLALAFCAESHAIQRSHSVFSFLASPVGKIPSPVVQPYPVAHPGYLQTAHPVSPPSKSRLPALKGQVALQLGRNVSEIDDINNHLDSILDVLHQQDVDDDAFLAVKTQNHTDAIAATAARNATLAAAKVSLQNADATLAQKQAELQTAMDERTANNALCLSETQYVDEMKSSLANLHAVGVEPGETLLQLGSIAKRITTADASDLEVFHGQAVSMVQRPYPDESASLTAAINNLQAKIDARKAEGEANVVAHQDTVNSAQAARDAAHTAQVVAQFNQEQAIIYQAAALATLHDAQATVAASKAATEVERQDVLAVRAKLEELLNETPTESFHLQEGFMSMIDVSMRKFESIVSSITMLLHGIRNKIDLEAANENQAKQDKYTAWMGSNTVMLQKQSDHAVAVADLAEMDTHLATAAGVLSAATSALSEETESQAREQQVIDQLSTLLSQLVEGQENGNTLIAMLQVKMGRDHASFADSFNSLIATLQASMLTTKNQLQAVVNQETENHNVKIAQRKTAADAEAAALATREGAEADYASKQALYLQAQNRLDANTIIRNREKALITELVALLAKIQ